MTKEAFADFSCCLQYRSPGNAPAWDAGCAVYYFVALSEIPDGDAPVLMKAIMTGGCGKFRPDPDEVLSLWRKLTKPISVKAEEVAGKMLELRRQKGCYQQRVQYADHFSYDMCEPPWTDPVLAKVSHAMGGWNSFVYESTEISYLRHHLTEVAASVLGGESDAVIAALRLEYKASRPEPALLVLDPEPEPAPEKQSSIGRGEAMQIMAKLEALLPIRVRSVASEKISSEKIEAV